MQPASDPLEARMQAWRAKFPALESCVHLVSHSLGCMPAQAHEDVATFLEAWQTKSITAWDEWLPEVSHANARIERILSAPAGTVMMQPNVSQAMAVLASCFDYQGARNKIVYEALQFPTVSYVWQAEQRRGARCVIVPSVDGITIDTEAMCAAIDEQTLLVPISHVLFSSAYIQDAKRICQRAHEVGAHVVLDCYQSIGTLPLDVVELGVSFACGGSVKYVCGGPGAGWLYIRADLVPRFEPRITGWFGHQAPFAFTMPEQVYADNAWRYAAGTYPILALYQSRAGQQIIADLGVRAIREHSQVMTEYVVKWVDELGLTLRSPRAPEQRGGSVSFDFTGAADVCRELNRRRFFCDHRPQAGIRISPHFYNTRSEIDLFFHELKRVRG